MVFKPYCFIGHNFGDYKNHLTDIVQAFAVLSVTILETTKTKLSSGLGPKLFYRSQFWRLQKPTRNALHKAIGFIGHNFGDYKNE